MDAILSALAAEVDSLKAQLAAANAQRDELLRAAIELRSCLGYDGWPVADAEGEVTRETKVKLRDALGRFDAIARAQSGQPAQRDDDGTASGGGAQ